jgi:hypothetical protein
MSDEESENKRGFVAAVDVLDGSREWIGVLWVDEVGSVLVKEDPPFCRVWSGRKVPLYRWDRLDTLAFRHWIWSEYDVVVDDVEALDAVYYIAAISTDHHYEDCGYPNDEIGR